MVLMEGVSDRKHLLTNGISYKKVAAALGVAEQHEEFMPQGKLVRADVDVDQFATNTIRFLNLVMGVHSKGVTAETMLNLSEVSPPGFEKQLFDDLLTKRNQHVFSEIQARLKQSDHLIVPWGAAHIPGIAREIQDAGFRLQETREFKVVQFHFLGR
jgi:uncharacterized protein YbaP (TraB family)